MLVNFKGKMKERELSFMRVDDEFTNFSCPKSLSFAKLPLSILERGLSS